MQHELASIREVLGRPLAPLAHNVEGFCSLHPIMRVMPTPDRRSCVRRHVCVPATVVLLGNSVRATMLDISATGCRLSGLEHVKPNDVVAVVLAGKLSLKGRVVWSRDGEAGVQFKLPV